MYFLEEFVSLLPTMPHRIRLRNELRVDEKITISSSYKTDRDITYTPISIDRVTRSTIRAAGF